MVISESQSIKRSISIQDSESNPDYQSLGNEESNTTSTARLIASDVINTLFCFYKRNSSMLFSNLKKILTKREQ